MSKKCIGCKRELAKHQTSCPACGAEQSFFKYHRTLIIVFTLIVAGIGYATLRYIDNQSFKIKEAVKSEFDQSLQQSEEKITALESELNSIKTQLAEANQNLEQVKAKNSSNSEQTDQVLNDLRKKLADADAEAKKQLGRAGWLGKENVRLKTEIEDLKTQISTLQKSSISESSEAQDLTTQSLSEDLENDSNNNTDNLDNSF